MARARSQTFANTPRKPWPETLEPRTSGVYGMVKTMHALGQSVLTLRDFVLDVEQHIGFVILGKMRLTTRPLQKIHGQVLPDDTRPGEGLQIPILAIGNGRGTAFAAIVTTPALALVYRLAVREIGLVGLVLRLGVGTTGQDERQPWGDSKH